MGEGRRPVNIVDMPQARTTRARIASGAKPAPLKLIDDLTSGKALTDSEAKKLRADLIDAYKAYADSADTFISQTNQAKAEAIIWSNIQDDEYATLADFAIDMGKANPVVAQAVRGMVKTARMAKVGAIMGPRTFATFKHYADNGGFGIWVKQ